MISDAQQRLWHENGYLIVEDVLSARRVAALRDALEARFALEGAEAGSEGASNPGVRRLCNLFGKTPEMEALAVEPIALHMARMTIGDDFRWQAMNFHDPLPRDTRTHQPIHADQSFFPNCRGYVNVIWVIDAMTEENGATRFVPGSHLKPWPLNLADPEATIEGEIHAVCPAGSAILVHGNTWHGGRINRTDAPRRVIHQGFACPNTAPQYEIAGALTAQTRRRLGAHCALIPAPLETFNLARGPTKGKSVSEILREAGAVVAE